MGCGFKHQPLRIYLYVCHMQDHCRDLSKVQTISNLKSPIPERERISPNVSQLSA